MDLNSSPTQHKTIQHAVTTWSPSVTSRLKLVQEKDPNAYSIILHHPGIPLSNETSSTADRPNAIALMVIRVPALLEKTSLDAKDSASFYLYDASDTEDDPVFLGANTVHATSNNREKDNSVTFQGLPEITLEELEVQVSKQGTRLELRYVMIADRQWIAAVVSLPNTFEANPVYVIVGGVMIAMASFLLSTCFLAHMNRVQKLNAIRNQAAHEKAQIFVDTAKKQALAERQLNEYIAHEVRSIISAKIAHLLQR